MVQPEFEKTPICTAEDELGLGEELGEAAGVGVRVAVGVGAGVGVGEELADVLVVASVYVA